MIYEVLKLIQTFVMKNFFLMVYALFKRFAIVLLLVSAGYGYAPPVKGSLVSKALHPYFISITEFNHNQKENRDKSLFSTLTGITK